MEVAGQWRREWAGAAEYGKVTEGGVTRQVARAMEVLHASAPGARMRVVRAAYHSSSGPGVPASSYMMHSSRRVISSGTRLLSPSLTNRPFGDTPSLPSLPSLPLEISSTPLESDTAETENYKVTEPDDSEISAPSKWKSSTGKNSIRMPSEESSSTDNASIIDLDPRTNHKSVFRKYSYDSENSDISTMKIGSRASPLLDAPVELSSLKYKSLLNGSNDWNNRRKSYSFEETAPLNEIISHSNGTMTMESSTDSGICKSSEIVNDYTEFDKKDRKYDTHEDSFKDWLNKNRQTSFNNKSNSFKSRREHNVVIEEPSENSITLQSAGKVSITIPVTLETDDDYQYKQGYSSEETDKRVKKVEFCKTELHFAAESGRVNIIATDEKPLPTNDFRRKKSAFMPINSKPERPITLFGEKKTKPGDVIVDELFSHSTSEVGDFDENTAATKSILKNKIPKPKPYLLGENMAFGLIDDSPNADKPSVYNEVAEVPTAVSIINRQLQSERRYSNDTTSSLSSEFDSSGPKKIFSRPINAGLTKSICSKSQEIKSNQYVSSSEVTNSFNSAKNKFKALQMSPTPSRSKTRQLRQSDLTYFGIQKENNNTPEKPKFIRDRIKMQNDAIDNIFQSVRLIQQISNSVCNSEAESEEAVEYQNVPFKSNFAPVPTPRCRTKYINKSENPEKVTILKPIIEQHSKVIKQEAHATRRSRSRKYEEVNSPSVRSISEPPKTNILNSTGKSHRRHNYTQQNASTRINKILTRDEVNNIRTCSPDTAKIYLSEEDEDNLVPTYINVIKDGAEDNKEVIGETIKPNVILKANNKNDVKIKDFKDNNRNQCTSYDRVNKAEIHKGSYNNKTNSIKKNKLIPQKVEKMDIQNSDQQSSEHLSISRKPASQENKHRNEKNTSIKKQNGSLRRSEKNVFEHNNNDQDKKNCKEPESTDKVLKPQHVRSTSRRSTKKDSIGHQKNSSLNSSDRHQNSLQMKSSERNGDVRHSKERPRSKRNEYVINYDDKNGTVASICKVSTDPRSTKTKKTSLERVKDFPKEQKSHTKMSEKINLLSRPRKESKRTESRA